MISSSPFDSFESAGKMVLGFLHRRFGFELWIVTRTEGDDWIVLQAEDHGYGVKEGDVYRWADSFCSQMIQGLGPRLATDSASVPAYAAAPIGRQLKIGAYVGVPLEKADGSLFGTLCAIDPEVQPAMTSADLELVELLGKMLSTVLAADLKAVEQSRLAQHWMRESHSDGLTGLANRRGWDQQIAEEEARARRYGTPLCVLVVDLDDIKQINDTQGHAEGDELLRRSARCIDNALRQTDFAARIGGDEFAILGIECSADESQRLYERLAESFAAAGINASIGMACRDHSQGLTQAWEAADQAMYEEKSRHRQLKGR